MPTLCRPFRPPPVPNMDLFFPSHVKTRSAPSVTAPTLGQLSRLASWDNAADFHGWHVASLFCCPSHSVTLCFHLKSKPGLSSEQCGGNSEHHSLLMFFFADKSGRRLAAPPLKMSTVTARWIVSEVGSVSLELTAKWGQGLSWLTFQYESSSFLFQR